MEANPIIDWKSTTASNTINIVVVGKVGDGKSATGNSILRREAFLSEYSFFPVTCSSELQRINLNDGHIINVIDTPGLFNFFTSAEEISGEIVKCINLAKVGIHAVLMVFSLRSQFSIEVVAAIEIMKSLFGDKIVDHMILVFTNGDILESTKKSLEYFISRSEPLRNIIKLCKDRVIVFNNTIKNMTKREVQGNELLSLVKLVNDGKPYSNKDFAEFKEGALLRHQKVKEVEAKEGCSKEESSKLMKENIKPYDDSQKSVTEIVKKMVKIYTEGFWEQLAKEQAALLEDKERVVRLEAENIKKDKKIRKLEKDMNVIKKQYEESQKCQLCVIL